MRFTWAVTQPGEDTTRLATLVAEKIWPGKGHTFGPSCGIAVLLDDHLAAGLIYHNYDPDAAVVEISGAAWEKGWLTRPVLKAMYDFPFVSLSCQAVVQRVPDEDTAQHRMLKIYGAERYHIPRLRGRESAENVFVLTDDAWAKNKFNQRAIDG